MRRFAIVFNPISGSSGARTWVERFRKVVEAAGESVDVLPTAGPRHAVELARDAATSGMDVVVAAGGDGTVNEVTEGLLSAATDCALAVLPRGTSNLVSRHLLIPRHPERAAEIALHGRKEAIDVGDANGRPFIACASAGWDAHAVELLASSRRGNIGFHSWFGPLWSAARSYACPPIAVRTAEGESAEGHHALVLNARPYAAFFRPLPEASITDGLLDVAVLRGNRLRDMARWTVVGLRRRLADDRGVTVFRTTGVTIEAADGDADAVPFQIDGDVGGRTPVEIRIRPRAVHVIRG